jgi:hypothetical protein
MMSPMRRLLFLCAAPLFFLAACSEQKTCPSGERTCAGECRAMDRDATHCGGCGVKCAAGETCAAGACACTAGLTSCGVAGCVDLKSDPANCGKCATSCGGLLCNAGVCGPSCGTGLTACGASCIDLAVDPRNCGKCGVVCNAGETCQASACRADLYAACYATGEIREASLDFHSAGTILSPGSPVSLAFTGTTLLAVNQNDVTLTVKAQRAAPQTVKLYQSANPGVDQGFALAVHAGLAFATRVEQSSVVVVDPATRKVIDEVPLGNPGEVLDPSAIAFAGESAFVPLFGTTAAPGQEVAVVDFTGVASCTPPDPAAPLCGAGCAGGTVCVSGQCQRAPCGKLAAARIDLSSAADASGSARPRFIVVNGTSAYVTCQNLKNGGGPAGNGKLAVIDTAAKALTSVVDLGADCSVPDRAVLHGTTLYVGCRESAKIVPVDLSASPPAPKTALDPKLTPLGLAFCGTSLYVGSRTDGRVARIDPAGAALPLTLGVCPGTAGGAAVADLACGF